MAGYVLSGKAERALTRLVRGNSAATSPTFSAAAISANVIPPQFTVRWSQSESNGEGAWVIWMPDTAHAVMYDTEYITPTGITACTVMPSGWYTIDSLQTSSSSVWLVLHLPDDPDSTQPPTAEFSDSAGQETTGETVASILVALISTDSTTGFKKVKQLVDSTVIVGGGGGGGGLSGEVDFIGALLYNKDTSTQQEIDSATIDYALYARTDTLDLATGAVNQGAWSKVFDTTPHENIYN